MFSTPHKLLLGAATAALTASASWPALSAPPADWSQVPTKTVKLFYPGQSSFQWLRSSEHPGAVAVNTGGACLTCHKGTEEKLGNTLVGGEKLEPNPTKRHHPVPLRVVPDDAGRRCECGSRGGQSQLTTKSMADARPVGGPGGYCRGENEKRESISRKFRKRYSLGDNLTDSIFKYAVA